MSYLRVRRRKYAAALIPIANNHEHTVKLNRAFKLFHCLQGELTKKVGRLNVKLQILNRDINNNVINEYLSTHYSITTIISICTVLKKERRKENHAIRLFFSNHTICVKFHGEIFQLLTEPKGMHYEENVRKFYTNLYLD